VAALRWTVAVNPRVRWPKAWQAGRRSATAEMVG
jgi:hypothetical protein